MLPCKPKLYVIFKDNYDMLIFVKKPMWLSRPFNELYVESKKYFQYKNKKLDVSQAIFPNFIFSLLYLSINTAGKFSINIEAFYIYRWLACFVFSKVLLRNWDEY